MQIKLKDDILTYVDLSNEIESPEPHKYSYLHTSKVYLDFEEIGSRKIIFKEYDSTPVETGELIELLVDEVINNKELLTVNDFGELIMDRFSTDDTEVEIWR